jgi:hypothetical protein
MTKREIQLEIQQVTLLYFSRQVQRDGSCKPDGGSPSTYSALPMRHWHALHCAGQTPVARVGVNSPNYVSATGVVRRRVEHASPEGPSMAVPPRLFFPACPLSGVSP